MTVPRCTPAFLKRKLTTSVAFLSALISLLAAAAGAVAAPQCTLPPLVADRVGSAQIFDSNLTNRASLVGRRDIIWGDEGPRLPGIYSMKYMTVDRDDDATHTVGWYDAHARSGWVMRKCDGSPATEFGDPNAPVDITRPEVRQFLYDEAVAPAANPHRYDAMAVDNILATNTFKRCGVERGGKLVRRYGGAHVDPAYTRDVADWLQWLGGRIHADGMCMAGNLWYEEGDIAGFRQLAASLDIVVDEGGFTRNCKASVTDAHWLVRLRTMRDIAKEKPLIVIDYVCPHSADMTPAALDWSLANYLLLKGDRTYLAIRPLVTEKGPLYDPAQLHVKTGRADGDFKQRGGVYYRQFAQALALVNPSSTRRAQFDLGSGSTWRDLRGVAHSGRVTMSPASALVLVKP